MNKEFYLVSILSAENNALFKHVGIITDLSKLDDIRNNIKREEDISFIDNPYVYKNGDIRYSSEANIFALDVEKVRVLD